MHLDDYDLSFGDDVDLCNVETTDPVSDDISFEEAINHPKWNKSMKEEYQSLIKNQTWELKELPPGRHAKWVFKTKPEISPTQFGLKSRLVARGFEHGIDYNDTFAPVVRWSTLRTIIAIAIAVQWEIDHIYRYYCCFLMES